MEFRSLWRLLVLFYVIFRSDRVFCSIVLVMQKMNVKVNYVRKLKFALIRNIDVCEVYIGDLHT